MGRGGVCPAGSRSLRSSGNVTLLYGLSPSFRVSGPQGQAAVRPLAFCLFSATSLPVGAGGVPGPPSQLLSRFPPFRGARSSARPSEAGNRVKLCDRRRRRRGNRLRPARDRRPPWARAEAPAVPRLRGRPDGLPACSSVEIERRASALKCVRSLCPRRLSLPSLSFSISVSATPLSRAPARGRPVRSGPGAVLSSHCRDGCRPSAQLALGLQTSGVRSSGGQGGVRVPFPGGTPVGRRPWPPPAGTRVYPCGEPVPRNLSPRRGGTAGLRQRWADGASTPLGPQVHPCPAVPACVHTAVLTYSIRRRN